MTRKISLVATSVLAGLALVPAAWSSSTAQPPDFWNYEQKDELTGTADQIAAQVRAGVKVADTSPNVRSDDLGALYTTQGRDDYVVVHEPALDARERAMAVGREDPTTAMLDAREQALVEKRSVQLSSGIQPDVVERTAAIAGNTGLNDHFLANDDRFRIDPATQPVPGSVTGSDEEIAWPEVGIGFGAGIAAILGLLLVARATRHRPLAH
jgi:hypothetical protein